MEIFDDAVSLEGDTHFISVDHENILQTSFEELKEIKDPSVTSEVNFYDEQAQDSSGPRGRWLRLCGQQVV